MRLLITMVTLATMYCIIIIIIIIVVVVVVVVIIIIIIIIVRIRSSTQKKICRILTEELSLLVFGDKYYTEYSRKVAYRFCVKFDRSLFSVYRRSDVSISSQKCLASSASTLEWSWEVFVKNEATRFAGRSQPCRQ